MGMSCNAHLYVLVEKGRGGESKNNMGILAHVFGRTSLGTTSQHTHVPSAQRRCSITLSCTWHTSILRVVRHYWWGRGFDGDSRLEARLCVVRLWDWATENVHSCGMV